jgi:hypothetical protein
MAEMRHSMRRSVYVGERKFGGRTDGDLNSRTGSEGYSRFVLKAAGGGGQALGPDGKTRALPGKLCSFLCQLLADLKNGNSVTILAE